jgi:hypothetical protein
VHAGSSQISEQSLKMNRENKQRAESAHAFNWNDATVSRIRLGPEEAIDRGKKTVLAASQRIAIRGTFLRRAIDDGR